MSRFKLALMSFCVCQLVHGSSSQAAASVEFGRDVLPIFRQNCVSCHGSSQQINGLRLDRRSSVFNSSSRRVLPGNSANSVLYLRLIGSEYGMQMPPTGPLRPEQINMIKEWIDHGADWPDSLANEADLPPLEPKAATMIEALRTGNRKSFLRFVAEDPKLLNARGPEGSTPFMYAVLYSDARFLQGLLKQGADPNRRNDVNATALMWAAADLNKARILLDHGADVNARSDDLRTPLMIAARRPGAARVVRLLLDRGANPNPNANPATESSPLIEAATAGDAATMELLIQRGADCKASGQSALTMAVTMRCAKCLDLLASKDLDRGAFTGALAETAVLGDLNAIRLMLDRGADVNAFDALGRTPLMYAAGSDLLPLDAVKLLIDRGGDVNAKNRHTQAGDAGLTVLDIAKLRGNTQITEVLETSGAKTTSFTGPALKFVTENTIASAIQRSIPLLQRSDADFVPKARCVSCHNNSLPAMAIAAARQRGFAVDERIASQQVKANVASLESLRSRLHQGFLIPVGDFFGPNVFGYILLGLNAERYTPDLNTDAVAMYLRTHQMPDGQWAYGVANTRPPLCSLYVGQTAISMRAIQLYAPQTDKAAYNKAVQLAADWLAKVEPKNNDDRGWRLMGLTWAGRNPVVTQKALRELLAEQRADGGWSDISAMESTAYATGKALVALQTAGLPTSHAAYERGVQFLLRSQQEDGSWYVRTRALAFQPYFDAGFPYGFDQWISAAATSWATIALALAAPPQPTQGRPRAEKSGRSPIPMLGSNRTENRHKPSHWRIAVYRSESKHLTPPCVNRRAERLGRKTQGADMAQHL